MTAIKLVALSLLTYWFVLGGAESFLIWLFEIQPAVFAVLR
jgi:hypothetical protein